MSLLVKDPGERRMTAADLEISLRHLLAAEEQRGSWKRKRAVLITAATVALFGGVSWLALRSYYSQWARYEAIVEIRELAERGQYGAACRIATRAERWAPRNAALAQLWPEISQSVSVISDPVGANVEWKPYSDLRGAWQELGRTPLQNLRLPAGPIRLRLTTPNYEPFECAFNGPKAVVRLRPATHADGMVTVPPGALVRNGGRTRAGKRRTGRVRHR